MYHYEYVPKEDWRPVQDELLAIIHKLQNEVREYFTFQYQFVGSSSRNMITRDPYNNIGFDFDINIEVNDPDEDYSAMEIREILRKGLDKITNPYGFPVFRYDYAENSTRVLTIKVKDRRNSRVKHSCDFCIINKCSDGRQQYIRYNKSHNSFSWEYQPKGYQNLPDKIKWIKEHNLWQDVRERYLHNKNTNTDLNKHSRTIFAETINEIWQQNHRKRAQKCPPELPGRHQLK